ncbi:unnamed protein product [Rotaria socialis]
MSFSSFPIIDLKADRSTIVQSLLNACSTTGFFYLRNHNLHGAQERMFSLAEAYFRLPLAIKEQHFITPEDRGYIRVGQENLDSANIKQIDEKEAFNIYTSDKSDQLPVLFAQPNNYKLISDFQRACYDLCMELLMYLADSFEIDRDYFTSRHKWGPDSADKLRLLHYPATQKKIANTEHQSIRAGAHSDYGSITLLFQHNQKGGLEVLDRLTNIWHPIEPYEDMIVVNFGDIFEYWSNGFIKSAVHRVVMPVEHLTGSNERFSIAYFGFPNHTTLLSPILSKVIADRAFEKDEHAKHVLVHNNERIITAGEHLRMRLNKTYKY